jgi:hypothetical protein
MGMTWLCKYILEADMNGKEIELKKKELARNIISVAKEQGTYTGVSADALAASHTLSELRLAYNRMHS